MLSFELESLDLVTRGYPIHKERAANGYNDIFGTSGHIVGRVVDA